jgi:hypothetical protein
MAHGQQELDERDKLDERLAQNQREIDEVLARGPAGGPIPVIRCPWAVRDAHAGGPCPCCGTGDAPLPSRADGVCDNCGLYVDDDAARWSWWRSGPFPSGPELMAADVRRLQDTAADRREAQQRAAEQEKE